MTALMITIPLSILLVLLFIKGFLWAVNNDQLTDVEKYKSIVLDQTKGNDHVE